MDDDAPLPDKPLRDHVLAVAMRAAEDTLRAHRWPVPEDGLRVIAYALDEALAEEDAERVN